MLVIDSKIATIEILSFYKNLEIFLCKYSGMSKCYMGFIVDRMGMASGQKGHLDYHLIQ